MFVQSSELGPPTPSPASVCGSSPLENFFGSDFEFFWVLGGAAHAFRGRGSGNQFRRLERHSGYYSIYCSNPFTVYVQNVANSRILIPENLKTR